MKTINLYIILIALLSTQCSQEGKLNDKQILTEKNKSTFPIIIQYDAQPFDIVNEYWLNDGQHKPLFFGTYSDTIHLNRQAYSNFDQHEFSSEEIVADSNFRWVPAEYAQLEIQIDTSQIISNNGKKSFPVLITNKSPEFAIIGVGFYISIFAEAINKEGKWQPIEELSRYICGTGLESTLIAPNESVLTTQNIYSGPFKTKLRLRIGNSYSPEFYGFINATQFESEWNENGSSKTLPNSS